MINKKARRKVDMLALWIVVAGTVIYGVSSFLPWIWGGFFAPRDELFMWRILLVNIFGTTYIWNYLLWLTPLGAVTILILALLQLFRQEMKKGLLLSMFILSLVALFPLFIQTITHCLTHPNYRTLEPLIGFFLTWIGLFTIILGSTLGLFGKKQSGIRSTSTSMKQS